ncbi:unnamed protein product [Dictyota dichotoma]|uniref:Ribosomal protein L16 n=1 Tax=Dictyota dichotoma TaxID=2876 RepID=Q2TUB9_DICDH|nr:ribosomal protein L16 [Dictyota dichotoma]AAS79076.1 ribosomal protein L16 [Dictyota dichotoma]
MQPRRTKYKKYYKPREFGKTLTRLKTLKPESNLELLSLEPSYINGKQIEAARQTIRRKLKKKGLLTILVYPNLGVSKKPISARMGKGKGKTQYWITRIKPGASIFRLSGIILKEGIAALKEGANKLPLRVKLIRV